MYRSRPRLTICVQSRTFPLQHVIFSRSEFRRLSNSEPGQPGYTLPNTGLPSCCGVKRSVPRQRWNDTTRQRLCRSRNSASGMSLAELLDSLLSWDMQFLFCGALSKNLKRSVTCSSSGISQHPDDLTDLRSHHAEAVGAKIDDRCHPGRMGFASTAAL